MYQPRFVLNKWMHYFYRYGYIIRLGGKFFQFWKRLQKGVCLKGACNRRHAIESDISNLLHVIYIFNIYVCIKMYIFSWEFILKAFWRVPNGTVQWETNRPPLTQNWTVSKWDFNLSWDVFQYSEIKLNPVGWFFLMKIELLFTRYNYGCYLMYMCMYNMRSLGSEIID